MQINLYLENFEKEIKDIKDIIELCNNTNNSNKTEILEYFLKEMESNFKEVILIKEKFILELSKIEGYKGAIIFDNGEIQIDILANKLDAKTTDKYNEIYKIFCDNNDVEFYIKINEYSNYDFDIWDDYDCLKCL